jgi:hypothetical protein
MTLAEEEMILNAALIAFKEDVRSSCAVPGCWCKSPTQDTKAEFTRAVLRMKELERR